MIELTTIPVEKTLHTPAKSTCTGNCTGCCKTGDKAHDHAGHHKATDKKELPADNHEPSVFESSK